MKPSVIVVGAGIGGLTAGLALSQQGISVRILERSTSLKPLGAALTLWANAMHCLERLGVSQQLTELGAVIDHVQLRTAQGRLLGVLPVDEASKQIGCASICVLRSDLQQVLLNALGPDKVCLDSEVVSLRQSSSGVVVQLANGQTEQADLLIGADGIHSKVRQILLDDGPPRYSGHGGWLGLAEFPLSGLSSNDTFASIGLAQRFGFYPCGQGQAYWFFCVNRREPLANPAPGTKRELIRCLEGWDATVASVVEATENQRIIQLSFFDRPASTRWGAGRVTLLGDAAHPMTPVLGQGACQTIEDAIVLAQALAVDVSGEEALRKYERVRQPRTARIQKHARCLSKITQASSPLWTRCRNSVIAHIPKRWRVRTLTREYTPALLEQD